MSNFIESYNKLQGKYNQFVIDNFDNGKAINDYLNEIKGANIGYEFKVTYHILYDYDLGLLQKDENVDLNLSNRRKEFRFALISQHETSEDFYGRLYCLIDLETGNIYNRKDFRVFYSNDKSTFTIWGNVHNKRKPLHRRDFFNGRYTNFN